jgi:hypothetical protein
MLKDILKNILPGMVSWKQKKKRKQEGHDDPETAHLYIGPWGGANLTQGLFKPAWYTPIKRCFMIYLSSSSLVFLKEDFLSFYYRHLRKIRPQGWGKFNLGAFI